MLKPAPPFTVVPIGDLYELTYSLAIMRVELNRTVGGFVEVDCISLLSEMIELIPSCSDTTLLRSRLAKPPSL